MPIDSGPVALWPGWLAGSGPATVLLLGWVGYPVAPPVSGPCGPVLDLAPEGLVWSGTPGRVGVPAVAPGCSPPSGVAALLPCPGAVLLYRLVGVVVAGLPDLGDGPHEPSAHWAASGNWVAWWARQPSAWPSLGSSSC